MIIKDDVIKWIKEYFADNVDEKTKAIIGISGGKDSTIAAALCVEALGKDRVMGVLMPDGEQADIEDSYRVVKFLDIPYVTINIGQACYGVYKEMLTNNLSIHHPVVYTNLPARIRMATLYAVAASVGGRVCNTSNLSEIYVGYSTKWGDGIGDFGPLRNFLVSEVVNLGYQLGLPEDLIMKTPSDGMSGVSDEVKMGVTYDEIEKYVKGATLDGVVANKIAIMHAAAAHKEMTIPSCPRG